MSRRVHLDIEDAQVLLAAAARNVDPSDDDLAMALLQVDEAIWRADHDQLTYWSRRLG